DLLALNLTANPQYARYDGEMPKKEKQTILLASIGSLAGYLDNGTQQTGICYYINDHLGTPVKIIDDQGQVIWDTGYMPFGKTNINVDTMQNNFRFPGQYFDAETGLHYNWHRYYDPTTGRYLTPDPIGLAGGINPFVYVLNDPINKIDPFGLDTTTNRVNLTFIFGDITFGKTYDDKGNSGFLFSAAFGFSASLGITFGQTTTNAPTIDDLEGWGTSAGVAAGSPIPFFGAEINRVTTDRPYENAYYGTDWGVGLGIGLPLTGQVFTGITAILFNDKDESENVVCD
ncbi:MAG: hypothetical protein FP812_18415, partial [Desulfobacula sp.]|nr:hypothetical protein [Desulfobacula sp.]